jgi:hypothetical protein
MLMTTQDGGIIDDDPLGRRLTRRRFPRGEQRMLLLQVSFDTIAAADPPKLREIIANASAVRVTARACHKPEIVTTATVIVQRAQRRLAWIKRQEAKA